MTMKRDFRLGYAVLGGSLGLLATTGISAAAEQITFVSQGGAYQQAQTVAILDPSAKKLGITINQDSIPDAWPAIKTQVGSGGDAGRCQQSERPAQHSVTISEVQFHHPRLLYRQNKSH